MKTLSLSYKSHPYRWCVPDVKFEKKSLGSEASWKSTNPSSAVTIAVAMARRARIRDGRSMVGDWTGLDWRMVRNKQKACAEVVDSAINQYTHAIHHQWTSLLVCNTPSGPDCRKYRVEQHSTIESISQCIHQTSPIPKEYAHMQWQSQFWKLCRGKISAEWNCTAGAPFKYHNTKPVLISCASLKMYSHGIFGRSSVCTLQYTSAELLPLHNFQKWDCRCRWAYSFGIGEVW